MKVLVTGAAGFIGSALSIRLLDRGDEPITVFNYGKHRRDFTYIDDIVEGIIRVLDRPAPINPDWDSNNPDPATSSAPYRVYNIGNNNPVELLGIFRKAITTIAKRWVVVMRPNSWV